MLSQKGDAAGIKPPSVVKKSKPRIIRDNENMYGMPLGKSNIADMKSHPLPVHTQSRKKLIPTKWKIVLGCMASLILAFYLNTLNQEELLSFRIGVGIFFVSVFVLIVVVAGVISLRGMGEAKFNPNALRAYYMGQSLNNQHQIRGELHDISKTLHHLDGDSS